ncbi:MAG: hypothetical protein GX265_01485, partial [Mollicutes bacterium]|nr:hypothetical protein [Mollicutes bacterium]
NEAQKNLKNLNDIYQKYIKTYDENKFKLRILLKKFENYGGLTEKEKTSMRISLELLESTRRDSINKIKEFLEDDIVFYLNKDKIFKIKESIYYEKPLIFLNYMEELKKYLGVKLTSDVKEKLMEHVNDTNLSIKYNASDRLIKQLDSICERFELTTSKEIKMLLNNTRDDLDNSKIYKKIISNNESANSVDLQELLKEIKTLEINIEELKFKIKDIEKDIAKAESDTKSTLLELETIEKKIDSERKEENSFNVARKILKASKEYKELQISKYLNKIAELSVKKFSDINNKENYISKIKFVKDTYNIVLYDNNGIEKDINILSAGEKQLLLSAIIWSIFKLSDRNTLFTFDTPLARLDKENRMLFVEKILGTISDQVLILSTNEEIVGNLLKIINKKINKKYLLLNDEKEGKTIIEEGYFL